MGIHYFLIYDFDFILFNRKIKVLNRRANMFWKKKSSKRKSFLDNDYNTFKEVYRNIFFCDPRTFHFISRLVICTYGSIRSELSLQKN